ncbi:hypothetical protein B0H13DRAFT_2663613 [Mycena leptocephala]|nr:hypothetical protein B0H13DRAFT_2663613 [Mycena leptocephala]
MVSRLPPAIILLSSSEPLILAIRPPLLPPLPASGWAAFRSTSRLLRCSRAQSSYFVHSCPVPSLSPGHILSPPRIALVLISTLQSLSPPSSPSGGHVFISAFHQLMRRPESPLCPSPSGASRQPIYDDDHGDGHHTIASFSTRPEDPRSSFPLPVSRLRALALRGVARQSIFPSRVKGITALLRDQAPWRLPLLAPELVSFPDVDTWDGAVSVDGVAWTSIAFSPDSSLPRSRSKVTPLDSLPAYGECLGGEYPSVHAAARPLRHVPVLTALKGRE